MLGGGNNMLKIAMCDEDNIVLQKVSSEISQFMDSQNYKHVIDLFSQGEELINICESKLDGYQIAFLEIHIGEDEEGFKVAAKLRELYEEKIIIIFLTAHDEYVFQCFEYSPFAFLRKSKIEEELIPILSRALIKVEQYKNDLQLFKTSQGEVKIDLTKVIYFEKLGRKTMIMTTTGVYETNYQLIQIEEMIDERNFIMIHRSIIVNMKYIFSLEKDNVILENKQKLPLSRHRVKEVKRAFNLY